ncbi:MAG: hypothetical protein HZC40_16880 [Chloroflexi bacterium]|nr:hypothetical protein [Chloroflexota bacterium]
MTTLLSKAMKRIETLPQTLQDEIAEQLLEDIANELKWQKTLAKPQVKLEKLAEKALRESSAGKTKKMGFDEL